MFKINSPVTKFLSTLLDLIFLNLIFVICCIPIFTIGAAWSSLYKMVSNHIEGRDTSLKAFFCSFKCNFKKATPLWMLVLAFFAITATDILYISHTVATAAALPFGEFVQVVLVILSVIAVALSSYLFPLIALNELPLRKLLAVSFYLAASNLMVTVTMTVLFLVAVALPFFIPSAMVLFLPLWLLIVFSGFTYLDALMIKACLAKYHTNQSNEADGCI